MTIKVGLDARMWRNTGVGRYIRGLVRSLPAQGVDLTVWGTPDVLADSRLAHVTRRELDAPVHSIREHIQLALDVPRSGVELFHSPHFNLPLLGSFQRVVTVHDLIPLHHQDTLSWAGRAYFARMATQLAPRKARLVLTDSEWTRRDLANRGVPPEKIVAVPLGIDEAFGRPLPTDRLLGWLERLGVSSPYILYAGQWKPYKNLRVLLAAFARLLEGADGTHPRPSLVLLGRPDPRRGLLEEAKRLGVADRVLVPGYLEDEEAVVALYQGAMCFAFPSRCEGFGLPPLEAMAAGTPVVCTGETALAEIVGDACIRAQADDVVEWSLALSQALWDDSIRTRLIDAGRRRASAYTWDRTAERTADLYREALVKL